MEKYKELANQVLDLTRIKLLSQLRFMSGAIDYLKLKETEKELFFATDGQTLWYNPRIVLKKYEKSADSVCEALLHVLLHCLFGHTAQKQEKVEAIWNMACDAAVVQMMLEMNVFVNPEIQNLAEKMNQLTSFSKGKNAEAFYNFFCENETYLEENRFLENALHCDEHSMWISKKKKVVLGKTTHSEKETAMSDMESEELLDEDLMSGDEIKRQQQDSKTQQNWKEIAQKVQIEMDFFQRNYGMFSGTLMDNLKEILYEEVDYSEFLHQFGSDNEVLHISEDEFDINYYTYGLELYGNVPLIEPLEYRDENQIKEFIIAIDTSGSVQGEVVEDFLRKTYNVLHQDNCFANQVNIYLLQCDTQIQDIVQIQNLRELDAYIKNYTLKGFGGTDFRPVFSFVEQQINAKKLHKVNGLLYFTDGVGMYPEKAPDYKTAFIFQREDYISPNVPEWAMKAVLSKNTIRTLRIKNRDTDGME